MRSQTTTTCASSSPTSLTAAASCSTTSTTGPGSPWYVAGEGWHWRGPWRVGAAGKDPEAPVLGGGGGWHVTRGRGVAAGPQPHPAPLQPTPIGTVHTDLPSQPQVREKALLYSKNQVRGRPRTPAAWGVGKAGPTGLPCPSCPAGTELHERGAECRRSHRWPLQRPHHGPRRGGGGRRHQVRLPRSLGAGTPWAHPLVPVSPIPFSSLHPLLQPAPPPSLCLPLPGAAVSSRGGRENLCSDTSDPGAVASEASRCSPSGPACPRPRGHRRTQTAGPAELPAPAWGHFLHVRLWPRFLHLCLVLPSESINYLKQGREKTTAAALPCAPARLLSE